MRMSFSRLAAVGAVLAAGVTLASCASSSAPIAASGPNPAAIGFPGGSARVHFIQGSPQLNLAVNNLDVYIDGKLAFPNFVYPFAAPVPAISGPVVVGPVTPYIELPIGTHDFRFTQHGTVAPVFLDATFTLKANTKYAIIPRGDAGNSSVSLGFYTEAIYNTSNAGAATSVFNASPRAGSVDFLSNSLNSNTDTVVALGLGLGSAKTNVAIVPSPSVCISAYTSGTTTPLVGGYPTAASDEHLDLSCTANLFGGVNVNLYLIDLGIAPATTSAIIAVPDSNG